MRDSPASRFSPEDLFIEVGGVSTHYVRAGAGHPIVLIHGLTGSTANWRRNIHALARHAAVYALDLVNMGQSGRMSGVDASLAATADRVAAWMDAVGLRTAHVAGHSHGGAIAMMLAARHPDRVRSLILFAPANPYSRLSDHLIRLYSSAPGRQLARMVPFLPRVIYRIALGRMYGDAGRIASGCLEGYTAGLRIPGTIPHILAIIQNWFAEMRLLKGTLPQIGRLPAMLVWGDRDRAVSLDSGLRMHQELPGSELHVIHGAGHVPFEEFPEECNRLMLSWLQRELPDPRAEVPSRGDRASSAAQHPAIA